MSSASLAEPRDVEREREDPLAIAARRAPRTRARSPALAAATSAVAVAASRSAFVIAGYRRIAYAKALQIVAAHTAAQRPTRWNQFASLRVALRRRRRERERRDHRVEVASRRRATSGRCRASCRSASSARSPTCTGSSDRAASRGCSPTTPSPRTSSIVPRAVGDDPVAGAELRGRARSRSRS